MTEDIVQRLRASLSYDTPARYPDLVTEAADQIETLRKLRAFDAQEIERLCALLTDMKSRARF
jgi:hypothetical protein